MATYFTDFSEYATSAQPSDWTQRWHTGRTWTVVADAGATGGQLLQIRGGGKTDAALSWDEIDSDADRDDGEVVFRFRSLEANGNTATYGMTRGSGGGASESAYLGGPDSSILLELNVMDGGSTPASGTDTISISTNTWYWVRVRSNGTSQKCRFWADGDTEPATWNIEVTDATITAAGWIGLFQEEENDVDIDVVGVGTNGDTAPTAPPSSGETASGALAAQTATLSGTATRTITGSGTPAAQQATLSGTATRTITGSGTPAAQQATLSGSASLLWTASGTPAAQTATLSGQAARVVTGTGALAAQTATLSGTGERASIASGSPQAQGATLSGAAIRTVTGSGTPAAQQATLSGSGSVSGTVDASGTLDAQAATISGTAARVVIGTGALSAQTATLSGSGSVDTNPHVGTETVIGNSGLATPTVNKVAGTAEDDIIIAIIANDDGDDVCNIPTGFTVVFSGPTKSDAAGTVLDTYVELGYKVASASEPATYEFSSNGLEPVCAAIAVFRGIDPTNVLDVSSVVNEGYEAADVNRVASSITPVTNGALILCCFGTEVESQVATPEAGFTMAVNLETDTGAGFASAGASVHIGWDFQDVAGPTGNLTFVGDDGVGDSYIAVTMALRPLVSPTKTATGALAAQSASTSASVSLGRSATGVMSAQTATLSGTAALVWDATGALTAQTATTSGTASLLHTASGDLSADPATLSGTAIVAVLAQGALVAGAADLSASVEFTRVASGAVSAGAADLSASIEFTRNASGALAAPQATLSGSGDIFGAFTATGALQAAQATLSGSGNILTTRTASGAIAAQTATLAGSGARTAVGSGTLAAQQATLTATGLNYKAAAGALVAQQAALAGSGTVVAAPRVASGALQAGDAIIDATVTRGTVAIGSLEAADATVGVYPWIIHHVQAATWTEQSSTTPSWVKKN